MRTDEQTDPRRHPRHRPLGDPQADLHRVQGGQPHRLGGRADLLRGPGALPRAARPRGARRHLRPVPADHQRADRRRQAGLGRQQRARRPAGHHRTGVVQNKGGAGALLGLGLAGALWSASGYIGAFMRASNAIYEVDEGRPFWKLRPLQVVVTLVDGHARSRSCSSRSSSAGRWPRRSALEARAGLRRRDRLEIAKWPMMAAVVLADARRPLLRGAQRASCRASSWLSPGAVVALVDLGRRLGGLRLLRRQLRLLQQDLRHARRRDPLLVWLWISNLAVLFGQELNAEIERGARARPRGCPAERDLQLEPRDAAQGPRGQGRRGLPRRALPSRGRGRLAADARIGRGRTSAARRAVVAGMELDRRAFVGLGLAALPALAGWRAPAAPRAAGPGDGGHRGARRGRRARPRPGAAAAGHRRGSAQHRERAGRARRRGPPGGRRACRC